MRTRDIKALNETIASVVDPADADRAKALQEGYLNSLTEKARQVISEAVETEKEDEVEAIMKRLAAKALKKAKKKARRSSDDDAYAGINPSAAKTDPDMKNPGRVAEELINEVAAPGMEDWASDPKVKASFKKQYGKRWKEVMYGRSWNLAKKEKELGVNEEVEELDELSKKTLGSYINKSMKDYGELSAHKEIVGSGLSDEAERKMKNRKRGVKRATAILTKEDVGLAEGVSAKRMRIIRKHLVSGKPIKPEVADFMDRSIQKKLYRDRTKFGGASPAVLGRARLKHSAMKAKGLAEADQLDEGKGGRSNFTNLMKRQVSRVRRAGGREDVQREIGNYTEREAAGGEGKMSYQARRAFSDANIEAKVKERDAKKAKIRAAMKEQVLAEADYKKLMRLKKKAYNTRNPKLVRATAELEAKVAANMARRGGASAEAVKAGGSRIGKSGKYTQKAGQLANQRDRALAKFRGRAVGGGAFNPPGPEKRKRQQAQAEFSNRARSGDFGQNNQEGMRPRYNYLKRTGKLKTYK